MGRSPTADIARLQIETTSLSISHGADPQDRFTALDWIAVV